MAKLGLQLYTVRDQAEKDLAGTLRAVARIGYDGVEHSGPGPMTVQEFTTLTGGLHLDPMGAHTGLGALTDGKLDATLDHYAKLGCRYLAISERHDTEDGWKRVGAALNGVARAARARGITFQYHNHAREFTPKFGSRNGLELIAAESDPALVMFQLDVGWVTRAGEDPVFWLRTFGDRIRTIHLKDTTAAPDPQWTEVGTGVLPLAAVHAAAKALPVEWYVVEQDTCARPTLESAALSYQAARAILST